MSKIIEIAAKEIGYSESPKNTNKTKFGKWFGLDGMAWCGMFVSWVYAKAGTPLPKIGFANGFANCQSAYDYFKKQGKITDTPVAGDIVFYDWNGDGRYDHTGVYVKKVSADLFEAIEGNTSLANQSNGGEVMARTRNKRYAVFVRP